MFKAIWTESDGPIEAIGATVDEALQALRQALLDDMAKNGVAPSGEHEPPLEAIPSVNDQDKVLIGCDRFIVGHIIKY